MPGNMFAGLVEIISKAAEMPNVELGEALRASSGRILARHC